VRVERLAVALAVLAAGCVVEPNPEGVLGEEGVAFFQAPFDAVFDARLMVGSEMDLRVEARVGDEAGLVAGGSFTTSDPEVIEIVEADATAGYLRLVGPGEAFLVLESADGEELDRIVMRAADSVRTELLDLKLLGTATDPRLPGEFGVVLDRETSFAITATDQCGGELFQVNALDVASSSALVEVETEDGVEFKITGTDRGGATLSLQDRAEDEPAVFAEHEVQVFELGQIDDVDLAVSDQEGIDFEIWGRAFAAGTEVVGLDFEWAGSADVQISNAEGPTVIGRVNLTPEGEAPQTALVSGEAGTVKADLDLMGVSLLVAERTPAPDAITPAASGCACDPSARCDPYAVALLGFGLWALGPIRRLRRRG
jgi:hypothetical protein